MRYRIYAFNKVNGYELISKVSNKEQIIKEINKLNSNIYDRYIIIQELEDRDELYEVKTLKLEKRR